MTPIEQCGEVKAMIERFVERLKYSSTGHDQSFKCRAEIREILKEFAAEIIASHVPHDVAPTATQGQKCQYHRPTAMYCLDCLPHNAPLGALLLSNRKPTQTDIERGLEIAELLEKREQREPQKEGK